MQERMARYDVRNDGVGPYAVFYCDRCNREFRTQPDVKSTIAREATRSALGGLLRGVPGLGDAVDSLNTTDQRYTTAISADQLSRSWTQVKDVFHECPTCRQLVCPTDWDMKASFCTDDTPRRDEIAEAQAQQAAAAMKGFANAFGLGGKLKEMSATTACAKCGSDTHGAKFCPECGAPQALAAKCPSCGADTHGAKFCPECGTKQGS